MIKPRVAKIAKEIIKTFFGQDELVSLIPPEGVQNNQLEEALQAEIKEYARDNNLYSKMYETARAGLVYGTSVLKTYWKDNTFKIEQVRLNDIFLDPFSPNPQEVKFIAHRVTSMTINAIKKMYPNKYVEWKNFTNTIGYTGDVKVQEYDIGNYQRVEFYDVYRYKDGDWYVSTLLPDDTALRLDEKLNDGNPFIIGQFESQFVLLREKMMPVRAYGNSFIAALLSIQTEYTIKRNQQIDATNIQLNNRFLVGQNAGLSQRDLYGTNRVVQVANINEVKELAAPNVQDSMLDTQQLNADMQEISGLSQMTLGTNNPQQLNQTATGMSILSQEASTIIDDKNRAFNENYFRPLMRRLVHLTYKYKQSSRFIGVDRTQTLKYKVVINAGVGSTNKTVKLNELDNAIQTTMASINTFAQLQQKEMTAKYVTVLDGLNEEKLKILGQNSIVEDAEATLKEQQEQEQLQQQEQQEQMQQPQPQGGEMQQPQV